MDYATYDAIVIGGGPAGTTAAAVLAQKGRKVVVLEKDKFPRYHVGESLIPFCYFPLERIGMVDKLNEAGFVRKQSVQFVGMSGKRSQPFYFTDHHDHPSSISWQVDRATFDQMLMENARDKGAAILEQMRVKNTITSDEGKVVGVVAVDADGQDHSFYAPVTVDCTGQDGLMIKRNGWRVPEKELKKTAVWSYFKGATRGEGRDEGATTIAYLPNKGWFWHIPLANDVVSIGAVADKDYLFSDTKDLETILWREIRKNPWIEESVANAEQIRGFYAAADYSYRSEYIAKDGVVLAGDAFSFLDPVFSSGVFLALVSGELVAEAIDQCHEAQDFSASMFEDYAVKYRSGIEAMRKIIYAFYDLDFNFKDVIQKHPDLHGDLTDCLIGNVFETNLQPLFEAVNEFSKLPAELPHGMPKVEAAVA